MPAKKMGSEIRDAAARFQAASAYSEERRDTDERPVGRNMLKMSLSIPVTTRGTTSAVFHAAIHASAIMGLRQWVRANPAMVPAPVTMKRRTSGE